MIRQAMILAAGKGTRMRPLTLTTPKPLVMVADKPLIVWHIERLKQAGISDIVINAGYLGNVLINALSAMELGVRLRFSDESVLDEPLETAGGIRYALSQGLLKDEPFLLINGDVWTQANLEHLSATTLGERLAHLYLVQNPDHNPDGDFVLSDGKVYPKTPDTITHTFSGLSVMSPQIVADVAVGQIAPLAPYLRQAMNDHKVSGETITDTWVDVGTLERLAWVNDFAKNL